MKKNLKILMFSFIITIALLIITFKATYCFMTIGDRQIIRFNTMGGNKIEDITYTYGVNTLTNKLPVAKREGYKFEGWYLEKEYTNKIKEVPYPEFSNNTIITLYAKWDTKAQKDNNTIIGILLLVTISLGILGWLNRKKLIKKKVKK